MWNKRSLVSTHIMYEATIIPALLHNCESWIGINNKHLKSLQDFQDKFIRKLLRLAKSTPKAIINWDIGFQNMQKGNP